MEKFPSQEYPSEEAAPSAHIEIEPGYAEFAPQGFLEDPVGYFEQTGTNIKTGEMKYDELGVVREDPTAVKDLPSWSDPNGNEVQVVGKRVNINKGDVGKSGDPFYEYKILERLAQMGLPAARPIAKIESGDTCLIIMERIPGLRWSERNSLNLKERGYTTDDINALMHEAEQKMNALKSQFEQAGIIREWKLQDMIFQIDVDHMTIDSITPTDWERTKIIENVF